MYGSKLVSGILEPGKRLKVIILLTVYLQHDFDSKPYVHYFSIRKVRLCRKFFYLCKGYLKNRESCPVNSGVKTKFFK